MELSHSQKNLIYDAVRYYQINKTVVSSDLYKECESVLNMFYEAHMFPPAYNTQEEDPIPLDQVEFD